MILETYYASQLGNGTWMREQRFEEFETLEQLEQALFLYRMQENLGYRVYDCTIAQYNLPNRDDWLKTSWYDKEAISKRK